MLPRRPEDPLTPADEFEAALDEWGTALYNEHFQSQFAPDYDRLTQLRSRVLSLHAAARGGVPGYESKTRVILHDWMHNRLTDEDLCSYIDASNKDAALPAFDEANKWGGCPNVGCAIEGPHIHASHGPCSTTHGGTNEQR